MTPDPFSFPSELDDPFANNIIEFPAAWKTEWPNGAEVMSIADQADEARAYSWSLLATEEVQAPLFSYGILFQQPENDNLLVLGLAFFDGNPEGVNILRFGQ